MLPTLDTHELPRALQQLLARSAPSDAPAGLPRRSFLKLAGASGFALGAFPAGVHGRRAPPTARRPEALRAAAAFVQIAPNGTVTVTDQPARLRPGRADRAADDPGRGAGRRLVARCAAALGTNDGAYVDPLFGMHLTGGSTAIKHSFAQYRELGARTRAMLRGRGGGALEGRRGDAAHARPAW